MERTNGDCLKFEDDNLKTVRQFERDVKDGRQFERDTLIATSDTKCHYYPPLDKIDTMSVRSEMSQKV